jgi:hypothetical protein
MDMSESRSEDAKLARLGLLAQAEPAPELAAELRQLIKSSSHRVVAQAAAIAAKMKFAEVADEIVAAFDRFLIEGQSKVSGTNGTSLLSGQFHARTDSEARSGRAVFDVE